MTPTGRLRFNQHAIIHCKLTSSSNDIENPNTSQQPQPQIIYYTYYIHNTNSSTNTPTTTTTTTISTGANPYGEATLVLPLDPVLDRAVLVSMSSSFNHSNESEMIMLPAGNRLDYQSQLVFRVEFNVKQQQQQQEFGLADGSYFDFYAKSDLKMKMGEFEMFVLVLVMLIVFIAMKFPRFWKRSAGLSYSVLMSWLWCIYCKGVDVFQCWLLLLLSPFHRLKTIKDSTTNSDELLSNNKSIEHMTDEETNAIDLHHIVSSNNSLERESLEALLSQESEGESRYTDKDMDEILKEIESTPLHLPVDIVHDEYCMNLQPKFTLEPVRFTYPCHSPNKESKKVAHSSSGGISNGASSTEPNHENKCFTDFEPLRDVFMTSIVLGKRRYDDEIKNVSYNYGLGTTNTSTNGNNGDDADANANANANANDFNDYPKQKYSRFEVGYCGSRPNNRVLFAFRSKLSQCDNEDSSFSKNRSQETVCSAHACVEFGRKLKDEDSFCDMMLELVGKEKETDSHFDDKSIDCVRKSNSINNGFSDNKPFIAAAVAVSQRRKEDGDEIM